MQFDLFFNNPDSIDINNELNKWLAYCPDFIQPEQANILYQALCSKVNWQQPEITVFGKSHPIPRLQAWMGQADLNYTYSGRTFTADPWLAEVAAVKVAIEQYSKLSFNSVLLNYYRNGLDKMGLHADNEPQLGRDPVIAMLSLGAKRDFQVTANNTKQTSVLNLANGSLLIMRAGMQSRYKHAVPVRKRVSSGRISLTFRTIFS